MGGAHLKFGLTGPRRKHGCAHGPHTTFKDHTRRGEVIAKTIMHDIALAHATGMEETPHTPPVMRPAPRLIDRTGALKDMRETAWSPRCQPSERGRFSLRTTKIGLAKHRQTGQRLSTGDISWVNVVQGAAIARQGAGAGDLFR